MATTTTAVSRAMQAFRDACCKYRHPVAYYRSCLIHRIRNRVRSFCFFHRRQELQWYNEHLPQMTFHDLLTHDEYWQEAEHRVVTNLAQYLKRTMAVR